MTSALRPAARALPTPNMLRALTDAERPAGLNPWDYPSSTIGAVKRLAYVTPRKVETTVFGIRKVHTVYEITEAGRKALREGVTQ